MLPLVEWLVVLREVFSGAQTMDGETTKEKPRHLNQVAGFWRRPTLARPIAVLPSGLQRFTAVFGMGTGGATALLSPELNPESFRDSVLVNCRFQIVDCRLNQSDGHPLSPRLQRDKWTAATRSTLTFQRT